MIAVSNKIILDNLYKMESIYLIVGVVTNVKHVLIIKYYAM